MYAHIFCNFSPQLKLFFYFHIKKKNPFDSSANSMFFDENA